jgi:hypothetical protein
MATTRWWNTTATRMWWRCICPARPIDEPIVESIPNGDGTYHHEYFDTNHQGSVVAMSADDGTVAEGRFKSDPYGNCFKGATPCAQVGVFAPDFREGPIFSLDMKIQ